MDFVKPAEVLQSMVEAGESKARMNRVQMLIRGFLAGLSLPLQRHWHIPLYLKLPLVWQVH